MTGLEIIRRKFGFAPEPSNLGEMGAFCFLKGGMGANGGRQHRFERFAHLI